MERDFDSVSVLKDKDTKGVIKLTLRDITTDDAANAEHNAGTLTVTATLGTNLYVHKIAGLDIQDAIKCQVYNGSVKVTVRKKSTFNLKDMIRT